MISVEKALQIILAEVHPLGCEEISINEAEGEFLYNEIVSNCDIPPFNNSAMDGYAIQWEDTQHATKEYPVKLAIIGEIQAGQIVDSLIVKNGSAVRIMTGAHIPPGANAVVQVEDTSENNDGVTIYRELTNHENIRFSGEDISKGSLVYSKGHRLKSADIGILISLNYEKIQVYKKPRVAILSTGDELVDLGEQALPGTIRNSNSYTLAAELKKYNIKPVMLGIARDTIEDLTAKMRTAMNYDILLTTGGVSEGKFDFIEKVMNELGIVIHFNAIKMKPGKPMVFGTLKNSLFFGLPGNPVSTMVGFIEYVRPALLRMMDAIRIAKPLVNAVSKDQILKKAGRTHFIRGYFTLDNGSFFVSTTGPQGSGILRSMSTANCLIILPENQTIVQPGEIVKIQLINHEEI